MLDISGSMDTSCSIVANTVNTSAGFISLAAIGSVVGAAAILLTGPIGIITAGLIASGTIGGKIAASQVRTRL